MNILARRFGILVFMLKIIHILLDTIFPPRESELVIRSITEERPPPVIPTLINNIIYLTEYSRDEVRALILENKYYNNTVAQHYLANILLNWINTVEKKIILIPIPLGKERFKERGYNQVMSILDALPESGAYAVDKSILVRTRDTAPQTTLAKTERILNMKNAFACNEPQLLKKYAGCTLVIIDDVITTGSTLHEARASLAPHVGPGTKIICLAIAH